MQPGRILLSCMVLVALALPALAAPDEDLLGKAAGYPVGNRANWFYEESVRVGSFSHLDRLLPHYTLTKAASPLPLPAAAANRRSNIASKNKPGRSTISSAHQRVTGFLLIKDGQVLVERYQYDRNARDRFISHSMAKSIVSLAIGMALTRRRSPRSTTQSPNTCLAWPAIPMARPRSGICCACRPACRSAKSMTARTIWRKFNRIRFTQGLDHGAARIQDARSRSRARVFTTPLARPWC